MSPTVSLPSLWPSFTNSKPRYTDGIPHNCYSDQHSFCLNCCPFAFTAIPTLQTVHRTMVIVTKISLPYMLPCCTNSKPHSTDGTPHISNSIQNLFCPPTAFSIIGRAQTSDGTPHNYNSVQQSVSLPSGSVALK